MALVSKVHVSFCHEGGNNDFNLKLRRKGSNFNIGGTLTVLELVRPLHESVYVHASVIYVSD